MREIVRYSEYGALVRESGGIGRRAGFRFQCLYGVRVRVPPLAPLQVDRSYWMCYKRRAMRERGTMTSSRLRGTAAALCVLLVLQAPLAAGEVPGQGRGRQTICEPRSIVVVSVGSTSRSAAEFEYALRSALARHGCFKTVDVVDYLEAGMGAGLARLETAREEAEAGTREFLSMRLSDARTHFAKAAAAYTDGFAYLSYEGPFVETLMYLGACEAALNNDAAAIEAFRAALVLNPLAKVADYTSLPEAARAFEAARGIAARRDVGALIVDSTPQGAQVLLDGRRFLGVTPLDAPDVPAGPHFVVLSRPGYVRKSIRVDVPAGGTAAVLRDKGALDEARRKPLFDVAMRKLASSEAGEAAAIEDIKALFLSDLALVVRVDESPQGISARATVWDLGTMQRVFEGREPREGAVSFLGVGAAESLANAILAAVERREDFQEPGMARIREAPSEGVWTRWWFWTAVGAVVVGGVTATVLLTRPKEKVPGLPRDGNGAVVIRF